MWLFHHKNNTKKGVLVQSLSCVQLFETPWTAAHQASLSFTMSRILLKLASLIWWCHPTISSSVACQEAFNFLCAVLDLSGTLWPLLIPVNIQELRGEACLSRGWGIQAFLITVISTLFLFMSHTVKGDCLQLSLW